MICPHGSINSALVFVLALGLLLASSTAHAQQQQEQQQEQEQEQEVAKAAAEAPISIVTYLGNDFILKDGCPQSECHPRDRACLGRSRTTKLKYDECRASEDGEFHGCVTDVLQNGSKLTVPVYASFCSGACYEKDAALLQKLERCPFVGIRHELTPALQRRLGVTL